MASIDLESQRGVLASQAHCEPMRSPKNISGIIVPSRKFNICVKLFISTQIIVQSKAFRGGYLRLARFLDSDDAFMTYRRFGAAFSRVLLQKQDEMSQ